MPVLATFRRPRRTQTGPLLIIFALCLLGACGKQDLYEAPGSPYVVVGRLPLPTANEGVAVIEHYAYVAAGEAGLHTVDWTDPASPQLLASINTTKYADDVQTVRTFYGHTLRDIAHIVEGTEGITSYDVTDPQAPIDYATGTTAVVGRTMFIDQPADPGQPYIVYLAEDWKGVRIFESVPGDPGILAYNGVFVGTMGRAYSLVVRDGWGYCAQNELGLCVLDLRVRDLASVRVASWADTPGSARSVALAGDYAFVADGGRGLAVFRIDGGATPIQVAQYNLNGFCKAIALRDNLCALAANAAGVHFMDVSNPTNPVYLGTTPTTFSTGVVFSPDGYCLVVDSTDGLLILGGRGPFTDTTPPSPVTDLVAEAAGSSAIDLNWTMTGDDHMIGLATGLEIRMAPAPITGEEEWNAATPLNDLPAPEAPGARMTHTVADLPNGTEQHFALRVADDAGHRSDLSNPASATTSTGITLRQPRVYPEGGTTLDTYTYEVEALWDFPLTSSVVIIDGTPHAMTLVAGDLYRYETTLAKGAHDFAFHFTADDIPDAETELADGPFVGIDVFTMGSPGGEYGRQPDEFQHLVVFTEYVLAASTEVTQAQWNTVMPAGSNPSVHSGADRPVDSVTWLQAIAYCNALSAAHEPPLTPAYTISGPSVTWHRDADGWRLPTEAEWEYLCRAGTTTALYNGNLAELNCRLDANLDAIGWYCGNAGVGTATVEGRTPNSLGLYDMSGNVREWCWDWYGPITDTVILDPTGPDSGYLRVCRGGSWYYRSQDCRSAARGALPPDSADDTVGLRVVRTVFTD
jgi:formylglycine-generating enzyme required for sulfatase activity